MPDLSHPAAGLPRDTLQQCLDRAARVGLPQRDGLHWLDRHEHETHVPWHAVRERARRAGGTLRGRGVRPGDRVAILLPTHPTFGDAFFGVLAAGAVPVPLYPPVRLGRLDDWVAQTAAMMRAADVRAVIAGPRVRRVLGKVLELAPPPLGLMPAEKLAQGPDVPFHPAQPDDLAMVQFSSGTTVRPKPVGLTHRQALANVSRILDFMPPDAPYEHVGVSWLPLYHDMGLIGCVFVAAYRAGPLALLPPEAFLAKPALWLRAISRFRGTVSPAPNFAWALCVERVDDAQLDGCDLSSWRLGLNGAEPVSPETSRAFTARFGRWGLRETVVTPVYGLSEAALAVTFSDPTTPAPTTWLDRAALAQGLARPSAPGPQSIELASVGRPLRDYAVQIRSPDGQPLPDGQVGHLFVAGPSLMRGYLDRTEQPIRDGWLDTGDVGFVLDGRLTITGRAKDVLILRGRNHAPHDVERAVDSVDGIRTGCAAAVADLSHGGERLLLFVEVRERSPAQAESCRKAALQATGLRVDAVLLLEPGTLPRTSSGKIRRAEALRLYQAGALVPPDPVTPARLVGAMARSALGHLRARRAAEDPDDG